MGRSRRQRMGQHFLVDRHVAEGIVALLADQPPRVLEIGPGRGALTGLLAGRFERVLAVELDPVLAQQLAAEWPRERVEVRCQDALREPVDALFGSQRPWQVAANLPYSVGSAILRRLLPRYDLFTRLVVMLQREVAQRIVAHPGDKGHGLLALERSAWAEAHVAFEVGPAAFRPRPRVVSSVLVVETRAPRFPLHELTPALSLAAHALTKARKKVRNAVPREVEPCLIDAGIDPDCRPGALTLEQWVAIVRQRPSGPL